MGIRKARLGDIDKLAQLFDDLNGYLAATTNYPGWRKGVYPTRKESLYFCESDTLYVAEVDSKIAGSIALTHEPEKEPDHGKWLIDASYDDIFVIHVLTVHPDFLRRGIAGAMLRFADEEAKRQGIKSILLDVYEHNTAAIRLYEKHGYQFIDKVDIGLGHYGLDLFSLYEKVIG